MQIEVKAWHWLWGASYMLAKYRTLGWGSGRNMSIVKMLDPNERDTVRLFFLGEWLNVLTLEKPRDCLE